MSAGPITLLIFGVVLAVAGIVAMVKAQSIADWNNNLKNPGLCGTTRNTRGMWIGLGLLWLITGAILAVISITHH